MQRRALSESMCLRVRRRQAMECGLGRFNDRRLEKGGTFCWGDFWRLAKAAPGFARSGAIGREKSGLGAFCITGK